MNDSTYLFVKDALTLENITTDEIETLQNKVESLTEALATLVDVLYKKGVLNNAEVIHIATGFLQEK